MPPQSIHFLDRDLDDLQWWALVELQKRTPNPILEVAIGMKDPVVPLSQACSESLHPRMVVSLAPNICGLLQRAFKCASP